MFKQGDIVLVPFPFTDLKQSKPRPAVVVSKTIVNDSQDVILAQISSKQLIDNFSFPIVPSELTYPLKKISQVRCHKIFTIQKSLIYKTISRFKDKQRKDMLIKINSLIDFEM